MSKVFVSYKRVDKEKVFPIVGRMETELGIKFWVDFDGIESDEQFSNVIVNAINKCEVFLFMYSKSHKDINPKKDWTVREITFADKKEKRIVFIDLDDYELPDWFVFRFPDQQVIKASDSRAMNKLVEDIIKWLRLPQPNPSLKDQGEVTGTVGVSSESASLPQAESTEANKPLPQAGSASHPQTESTDTIPDKPLPEAIDLGLPSGTKWASFNVGATKPEEYGCYYAWGETKEKKSYNWKTYIHCGGSSDTCHDLGKDISGTEYDVATMEWGGHWRMPTKEQIDELLDNCNQDFTTLNGVKGIKFTSKLNGDSIFLPAAGNRWNMDLSKAGKRIYYWSSTQSPSNSYCAFVLFSLWGYANNGNAYDRSNGRTVRPVSI